MLIDEIDISDLSDNPVEAFIQYEERLRKLLIAAQEEDRKQNSNNGEYWGHYAPERHYVSMIMAFLDEHELDIQIKDITSESNFGSIFDTFFNEVARAKMRLKLRQNKNEGFSLATTVEILPDFKDEIGKHLSTIRKIVNTSIQDENKKDKIFKAIAKLQSEVDRDRTTFDALLGRFTDVSKTINESANVLEPAIEKLERVMNAITKGTEERKLLPKNIKQRLLSVAEQLDSEIPF